MVFGRIILQDQVGRLQEQFITLKRKSTYR